MKMFPVLSKHTENKPEPNPTGWEEQSGSVATAASRGESPEILTEKLTLFKKIQLHENYIFPLRL